MTDRTEELYRDDSYLRSCDAKVLEVTDRGAIILDRTVFYFTGGGQPGDSGTLTFDNGSVRIGATIQVDGDILHIPEEGQTLPSVGTQVTAEIDWDRRYRLMKMHTAMHLLCALVPCGVTGGQVGEDKSRLDFDVGDHTLDKEALTEQLNQLIAEDHTLETSWISDAELDANPDLVRTMPVQPPRNAGRIRLVKVGESVDLQPCGGTHIAHTGEIGALRIGKIENKGAKNRRVNIHLES